MLAVAGGVINVVPVNMGAPPVGVVYQLKVAPGVVDDAVNVPVCPEKTVTVGGVTATLGAGLTVTTPVARVVEVAPVDGLTASA